MIKDRGQKEMLYKHFRAQGWMAQVEVPVVTSGGVNPKAPPVTDIDVLGIRPSEGLEWQFVIGDCKTKRRESPVNRVLWVAGLQHAVGATSAVVLLKRESGARIEQDHKLFAERLDTLLIEEAEFANYDRAVVYPRGSREYWDELSGLDLIREKFGRDFPALAPFCRWITSEAWGELDHPKLLRQVLGRARDVRGEIDPRRDDHLALALEIASAFAVPFASLVGMIFRRHLQPEVRADLDEAVRVIIWGGREQYEFFDAMRREIAAARGRAPSDPLALPSWDGFLEILRAYLEAPHLAFRTPQLLRRLSAGVASGRSSDALHSQKDKMLLLLAQRLALYVMRAAEFPNDASQRITALITPRITELSRPLSATPTGATEIPSSSPSGAREDHGEDGERPRVNAHPAGSEGESPGAGDGSAKRPHGESGTHTPRSHTPAQLSFDAASDVRRDD
jgi:hypothetical protein